MNVLSLFAGIGGLELGLERAGMTVVGQVELDAWCRDVLAKHWPEVPRHDDVRTAGAWWNSQPRPRVDLVAGGPPCQGHSVAGKKRGTGDERWGWPWMRSVVNAVRPRLVLIENVPNLRRTGLRDILDDLADDGFDAWWGRVPAAALGAPHLRWRLFLVAAHRNTDQLRHEPGWSRGTHGPITTVAGHDGATWALADTARLLGRPGLREAGPLLDRVEPADGGWWAAEPDVARVVHGLPTGMDQLERRRAALGNAVVPQVAEHIGRLILASEAA